MTDEELKRVIEIYGENYDEIDIPAYIRNRIKRRISKAIKKQKEMADAFISDFSKDYPLGGSIEPYDIWKEKKLCHEI